jgi:RNA polymerase sigma factor (sigma-70 family)
VTAHATDDPRSGRTVADTGGLVWSAAAAAFAAWRDTGDPGSLDRLVRLLTPNLWQIVRAYGLSRPQAEDAVQTTWLAMMDRAGTIREPQAVGRWVTTVARREAWRMTRAVRQESPAEAFVLDGHAGLAPDPATEVVLEGTARQLWRHVAELSDRCRRLLRVIAFDDRPDYAALSGQLEMPVGSIGPTRGRCLDKLRQLLDRDPEWSDR